MEIKQGIVRNYVVTDREKFCDMMARSLCQMQISYVQIDNEFHFNDKIYRFYNFGEVIELSEQVSFVCLDKEKLLTLAPRDLLFAKDEIDLSHIFDPLQEEEIEYVDGRDETTKYDRRFSPRQIMKHDNKMIKQKVKNSYKKPIIRNRRNG